MAKHQRGKSGLRVITLPRYRNPVTGMPEYSRSGHQTVATRRFFPTEADAKKMSTPEYVRAFCTLNHLRHSA